MYAFWQHIHRLLSLSSRLVKLVWETSPKYTLLAILLTVAGAAVLPAQIWISKVIIDQILDMLTQTEGVASLDWYTVLLPIGGIALVWILGVVCQSTSVHMRMLLGMQTANYTEYLLLQKASQLDISTSRTGLQRCPNSRRDGDLRHLDSAP